MISNQPISLEDNNLTNIHEIEHNTTPHDTTSEVNAVPPTLGLF